MNRGINEEMGVPTLPTEDLEHVLGSTFPYWEEFRRARVLITGGTGFIGSWLLESLAYANRTLGLGTSVWVLTRNPERFKWMYKRILSDGNIFPIAGDVRSFAFPEGNFSFVIHCANEANDPNNRPQPLVMLDTIVEGTKHVLEFARSHAVSKVLYLSSGAVYGEQLPGLSSFDEDYAGAPRALSSESAYAEGKRLAELLCAMYAERFGFEAMIARCFTFVGPKLSLDRSYAVGNFIRNGLLGEAIVVRGTGTSRRTYLYASDLAVWLWRVLMRGKTARAYNVGGEAQVSILELAKLVSSQFEPSLEVRVEGRTRLFGGSGSYIPSIRRAKEELGLEPIVGLKEGIQKTIRWHQASLTTERE